MDQVEVYLDKQTAALRNISDVDLSYQSILDDHEDSKDLPPVDVQIAAAFQELRQLKAQHLEMRTRELFLNRILDAKSFDELAPMEETGRLEVEVNHEKTTLRQIKKARSESEKSVANAAIKLEKNLHHSETEKKKVASLLQKAKYSIRSKSVDAILAERDINKIESLVPDIDELDTHCCDKIIQFLREEKNVLRKEAHNRSEDVDNMRVAVEQLQADVDKLELERNRLQNEISKNDQKDPNFSHLRHECMLQEQLESVMASLTGLRVAATHNDGISFEINASVLLPDHETIDRDLTYELNVKFDEENLGITKIVALTLRPQDVQVTDICDEPDLTLPMAVQLVYMRLIKHLKEKIPKL